MITTYSVKRKYLQISNYEINKVAISPHKGYLGWENNGYSHLYDIGYFILGYVIAMLIFSF